MKIVRMYHGKSKPLKGFSYDFITAEGNNQEGAGFYLTSDKNDAKKYGNYIYIVDAAYRKLVPQRGIKNTDEAKRLILLAPDVKEELLSWGDTSQKGLWAYMMGLDGFTKPNNPLDMFTQIWIDFYRYSPAEWMKAMVKLGYDGTLIKQPYGKKNNFMHFIAYDPKKLKIVAQL